MGISKFTNREENQFHLNVCIEIEKRLIHYHNVMPKREWYLILDREDKFIGMPRYEIINSDILRNERYRCPDLLWWDNGLWVLEVDGYVHYIKSEKTEKRNKIYRNNNCHFITVDIYEMGKTRVQNRKIDDIIKEVDMKIGRIHDGQR